MNAEELVALAFDLQRRFAGREIERVQPVDRSGVHLSFAGLRSGLRLDCAFPGGAALPFDDGPSRLKGGRGAWPDLAAAADSALAGRCLDGIRAALRARVLALECGAHRLALVCGVPRGASLVYAAPAAAARVLPAAGRERQAALVATLEGLEVPADLTRSLRAAIALRPTDAEDFHATAREALHAWPRALVDTLLEGEGARVAERVESFAERLEEGRDASGALIGDRVAAAYPQARREALEGFRLQEARALLKAETRRVRRALDAVGRDEARARDPGEIRARAEALLAAGPALRVEGDAFVVPDPCAPGHAIEVPRDPPGATPHQLVERLFARARKEQRSVEGRAERRGFLEQRLAGLERAAGHEEVEALEEALRGLGLGAGLGGGPAPAAAAGARKKKPASSSIRVFRSPGGFEVLAGRNARQNERLTFKIAAPDDFWMHVEEMPGSHVVVRRRDGVDPGEEDLRFAAGIAAALSQAPEGIQVDVHVARRKHVRKPRGAPPGLVTVRKAKTIRVRVGRAPQE